MDFIVKNKPVFLTDADGVLTNWDDTFEKYLGRKINGDTDLELIRQFNVSNHLSGMLPPMPDAIENMQKIYDMGFDIHIITCFGDGKKAVERRKDNISNLYPYITRNNIHCLPMRALKAEMMSKYEPTFYVDDFHSKCVEAKKCGHLPILLKSHQTTQKRIDAVAKHNIDVLTWNELPNYVESVVRKNSRPKEVSDRQQILNIMQWKKQFERAC